MPEKEIKFPENFLWGAATSAYQVEGDNCYADWWFWEQQRAQKKKDRGEWTEQQAQNYLSGRATDHYHLFKDDFAWAQKLNHNVHRLSIEWSRIEPRPGEWKEEEINHYREVLEELKEREIKTMVTLWHFTLPQWLAGQGGWENKKCLDHFLEFTEKIVKELGELIDFWLPLNEPIIYIAQTYLSGQWPPEKKNQFFSAGRVLNHLIRAHKNSYRLIHLYYPQTKVGLAKNNIYFAPARKNNSVDRLMVRLANYFWNYLFLNRIKNYQDFIGLNYYFHNRLRGFQCRNKNKQVSDLGWEIYPEGIYHVLLQLKRYRRPIYITENGLADGQDDKRARFIIDHLVFIHQAMEQGADVRGYLHWSLLDNFEWAYGFQPRFGLIEIDYQTMAREPRPSAYFYAMICAQNKITAGTTKTKK